MLKLGGEGDDETKTNDGLGWIPSPSHLISFVVKKIVAFFFGVPRDAFLPDLSFSPSLSLFLSTFVKNLVRKTIFFQVI